MTTNNSWLWKKTFLHVDLLKMTSVFLKEIMFFLLSITSTLSRLVIMAHMLFVIDGSDVWRSYKTCMVPCQSKLYIKKVNWRTRLVPQVSISKIVKDPFQVDICFHTTFDSLFIVLHVYLNFFTHLSMSDKGKF